LSTESNSRVKALWLGLVAYFLIFLNAIRYAHRVSYQVFVLGALFNAAFITVIVLSLKRAYKDRSRLAKSVLA
jgi:hypothetical protein